MNAHRKRWLSSTLAVAVGCMILGWGRPSAGQDPDYVDPQGMQTLTRGPVHEAFAEPVVYDPTPGPVIPKPPPQPIEELPPDQRPEGVNVQWVPGYWAWDDGRNDYLWVSGVWRDVPPGRHWVPGYWNQVEAGFQWVSGAWAPDQQADAPQQQYYPTPPPSIENGPNSPPPSPDATWSPGCWNWVDDRYAWRPGFWVPFQPDWVWVPAHYVWSPSGYLFINGYWDRPILQRGTMFAPVYFQQPIYAQPNFVYTPAISLVASALVSSLFVRPSYNHYYFGDYYANNNVQSGYYPWYSYHQSRYGYDPLFAHYATMNVRRDPNWLEGVHQDYRYRYDHPDARPAQTFMQMQRTVNVTNVTNVARNQNLMFARPFAQVASAANSPIRFEHLNQERRAAQVQQAAQLGRFREQRVQREAALGGMPRPNPNLANALQPRPMQLPRSPIAARPLAEGIQNLRAEERARFIPPSRPQHPPFQANVQPQPHANEEQLRQYQQHQEQLRQMQTQHQEQLRQEQQNRGQLQQRQLQQQEQLRQQFQNQNQHPTFQRFEPNPEHLPPPAFRPAARPETIQERIRNEHKKP